MNHIRDKLPDMKARLNTLMGQTQQELNSFGDATFLGEQHRGSLILKLMTDFARDFVSSIEGTSLDISTKELCGGARIYYIFNDVFGAALESINPTHNLTTQDIRTAIRNSTGPRPSLFVPEVAFDLLVKPQIKLLEGPSLRCVELVYEELMKICHNCTSAELQRFPRLHAQIVEVVSELLRERLGPTSEYASSLISIQAAYINTNHPEFVAGSAAIAREGAPARGPAKTASLDEVDDVSEEDEEEDHEEHPQANGSTTRKGRTISISSQNIAAPTPRHLNERADRHRASSGGALSAPPNQPLGINAAGTSPHSARETFLTYFFGGPDGQQGPPGQSSRASGPHLATAVPRGPKTGAREMFPDLGTRGTHGPSSSRGQNNLEPNTAYDMRSLSKHLEAVPADETRLKLTPREEMETTLIRSLIASYFAIVRQTIQDIVPKAIMHLLVNHSRDSIQQRLVTNLYKPDLFQELLYEDEALVSERTRVKALLDAYKEAFRVLAEVSLKSS